MSDEQAVEVSTLHLTRHTALTVDTWPPLIEVTDKAHLASRKRQFEIRT